MQVAAAQRWQRFVSMGSVGQAAGKSWSDLCQQVAVLCGAVLYRGSAMLVCAGRVYMESGCQRFRYYVALSFPVECPAEDSLNCLLGPLGIWKGNVMLLLPSSLCIWGVYALSVILLSSHELEFVPTVISSHQEAMSCLQDSPCATPCSLALITMLLAEEDTMKSSGHHSMPAGRAQQAHAHLHFVVQGAPALPLLHDPPP